MNCSDYESLMMDELYEELDPERSAQLAQHKGECAACRQAALDLRAFKADLQVPAVEIPAGLHERIMAKVDAAIDGAHEADGSAPANLTPATPANLNAGSTDAKVLRPRWGMARVISTAGAWAMRPQTAMAAVFLLMVGSSAWLLRGQRQEAAARVELEQGAPLGAEPEQASSEPSPEAEREAHGLGGAGGRAPAAPAAAAPAPPADLARLDDGLADPVTRKRAATAPESLDKELGEEKAKGKGESGGFAEAMAAYRAGRYDDATAGFDALARQGDRNAELWAARAVRDGHDCRTALTRYDHLGSTAMGTAPGNDAIFEGALCYRRLGQIESSTQHFQRLLAYEGYSQRARAEIDTNRRILVARREAAEANAAGTGGAAARSAAPAPAKPAAKSTADTVNAMP